MQYRKIKLESISNIVCSFFNVIETEVFIKTRKREVVKVRQIFHYLCYKYTYSSYSTIGKYNDNYILDHATVLHSNKTVRNLMETDKNYNSDILKIETMVDDLLKELKSSNTNELILSEMMLLCNDLNYNKEYVGELYNDLNYILTQENLNNIEVNYEVIK